MRPEDRPAFGNWVKQRRQALGLTQKELAGHVRCSVETIRKIEAGARRPSHQVADLLAATLQVPLAEQAAFVHFARQEARGPGTSALSPFPMDVPGPPAIPEAPASPPTNLPTPLTSFVGRKAELARVRALLRRVDVRLLTLTGAPGIGKTRLALEAATELRGEFGDGVFLIALAAATPERVGAVIAHTLGVADTAARSLLESIQAATRDKRMLLVLDNFEQVTAAAPGLVALLAAAPGLKALCTSRVPLHVYGEHEFTVPPLSLAGAEANAAGRPEDSEAVQLFVKRALAVQPDFALTAENVSTVVALIRHLDGLPLAIELAAARVKFFPPAALLARLAKRLDLLTGGGQDLPARQQTLRGALTWSYDLLSAPEQRLFQRLAVFAGGFTVDAVAAICYAHPGASSDVLEDLLTLADKSLLMQQPGAPAPRFGMLETIREYALEQLVASGEEAPLRERHARFYEALAQQAEPHLLGAEQESWLDRLEAEHDNIRAVLAWMLQDERTDPDEALRLATALFRFWNCRSYLGEGRQWLQMALDRAEAGGSEPGPNESQASRATALSAAGWLAYEQGDYAESRALNEASLALRRALGDNAGIATSLNSLGVEAMQRGDYPAAERLLEESLALRRELGNSLDIAQTLNNLGTVAGEQNHYGQARAFLEESLALHRQVGDYNAIVTVLNNLGVTALYQGDYAAARRLLEECLHLAGERADTTNAVYVLVNLGEAACAQGDYGAADGFYERGLALLWKLGIKGHLADALEGMGKAAAGAGRPVRAAWLFGAAEAMREASGTPRAPSDAPTYERALAQAQALADPIAWARAWADGQALPLDQVVARALAPEPGAASGENRT